MKNKKLIALLCSSAIAVSAFAGFSTLAFADGEEEIAVTSKVKYTMEDDENSPTVAISDGRVMAVETGATVDGHDSKVLIVHGQNNPNNSSETVGGSRYSTGTIDISSFTQDAKRIVVDYDSYIPNTSGTRATITLEDTVVKSTGDHGFFTQGQWKGGDGNLGVGAWYHTNVDITFNNGQATVTYKVTDADGNVYTAETSQPGEKTSTVNLQKINNIIFTIWSVADVYVDDLEIKTGGTYTIEPIAAETASTVEGSDIALAASGIFDDTWATATTGTETKVLNHSKAKKAQNTTSNISAYDANVNIRGYSVYAAFDFLLEPSASIDIIGRGSSTQAATLRLTTNEYGVLTVTEIHGSDSGRQSKAPTTLAHGTWYRAIVEYPQNGTATDTTAGNLNFTIYRIDPSDPAKTSEVATRLSNVNPRTLKAITGISIENVSGNVYLDNMVTYKGDQSTAHEADESEITAVLDGTNKLNITDSTKLTDSVFVAAVTYNNSALSAVKYGKKVDLKDGKATVTFSSALADGDVVYVWTDNQKPLKLIAYAAPAQDETTVE